MNPFDLIKNFPIRYKLLFIYSTCFMVIISLSSLTVYAIVKQNVETRIESELKNATAAIYNSVKIAVSVSIKNRLRGVAEKNHESIQHIYNLAQKGEISNAQAMDKAPDIVLNQRIGTKGYVCILDGSGRIIKHPEKSMGGLDISDQGVVQKIITTQDGYIEYDGQDSGNPAPCPNILYLKHFKPWNWIIAVSSYRDECLKLVDINDFKEGILRFRFGETGYAYVMDTKGNIIIHPTLAGTNVLTDQRFSGPSFKDMLEKKSGKLIYSWKAPDETRYREKLVVFNYIPEYDWIVASSSDLDEIRAPLYALKQILLLVGMASLVLFIPISALLSETITKPLHVLITRFQQDIAGGFKNRGVSMVSRDEVGQLAFYYNAFMDRLDAYDRELNAEINERRQVQKALTESEERYRSVMESVPDPILVYDINGHVTYMNPAFTEVFGYTLKDNLGPKLDRFVPRAHWKETMEGIQSTFDGIILPGLETQRKAKNGRIIDVTTRGAVYRDRSGNPLGVVIIHRDISEVRRLEKAIMETGEKERQAIGNDLHDDLCPHLIGIEGLVKVLKQKVGEQQPEVERLSVNITELIREAIAKTRGLARGLCPVYFNQGLEAALEDLVTNTRMIHNVNCRLNIQQDLTVTNPMAVIHLYHITGEAVRNAIRHGHADHIEISLETKETQMIVTIQDNGSGMDPDHKSKGMGLRIMNYRAKLVGASLSVTSDADTGTCIKLTMPMGDISGTDVA